MDNNVSKEYLQDAINMSNDYYKNFVDRPLLPSEYDLDKVWGRPHKVDMDPSKRFVWFDPADTKSMTTKYEDAGYTHIDEALIDELRKPFEERKCWCGGAAGQCSSFCPRYEPDSNKRY